MGSLQEVLASRHVRVLLAGNNGWCDAMAGALSTSPGIEVAGEAHDGEEALARARELEPDVVVLDPYLLQALGERAGPRESLVTGLTGRELEVLALVAESMTNKEIAGRLFISQNTVKNHIRNILEKLHLHSRMEAVTYAWRNQMLNTWGGGPAAVEDRASNNGPEPVEGDQALDPAEPDGAGRAGRAGWAGEGAEAGEAGGAGEGAEPARVSRSAEAG